MIHSIHLFSKRGILPRKTHKNKIRKKSDFSNNNLTKKAWWKKAQSMNGDPAIKEPANTRREKWEWETLSTTTMKAEKKLIIKKRPYHKDRLLFKLVRWFFRARSLCLGKRAILLQLRLGAIETPPDGGLSAMF